MYKNQVINGRLEFLMARMLALYRLIVHGDKALNPNPVKEILHQQFTFIRDSHREPMDCILIEQCIHCLETKRGGHRSLGYGDKGGPILLFYFLFALTFSDTTEIGRKGTKKYRQSGENSGLFLANPIIILNFVPKIRNK